MLRTLQQKWQWNQGKAPSTWTSAIKNDPKELDISWDKKNLIFLMFGQIWNQKENVVIAPDDQGVVLCLFMRNIIYEKTMKLNWTELSNFTRTASLISLKNRDLTLGIYKICTTQRHHFLSGIHKWCKAKSHSRRSTTDLQSVLWKPKSLISFIADKFSLRPFFIFHLDHQGCFS